MDSPKSLIKDINKDLEKNSEKLDDTKLTLLTAGLLVGLSLGSSQFTRVSIFHHSVYKLTLIMFALSAIVAIVPYVLNEIALEKIKKFLNSSDNSHANWLKREPPIRLLANIVNAFNNLGTILCLITFIMFIYMIINTHY